MCLFVECSVGSSEIVEALPRAINRARCSDAGSTIVHPTAAFGALQTCPNRTSMSVVGGKADINVVAEDFR